MKSSSFFAGIVSELAYEDEHSPASTIGCAAEEHASALYCQPILPAKRAGSRRQCCRWRRTDGAVTGGTRGRPSQSLRTQIHPSPVASRSLNRSWHARSEAAAGSARVSRLRLRASGLRRRLGRWLDSSLAASTPSTDIRRGGASPRRPERAWIMSAHADGIGGEPRIIPVGHPIL